MILFKREPSKSNLSFPIIKFFCGQRGLSGWRYIFLGTLILGSFFLYGLFFFYLGAQAHRQQLFRGQFLSAVKEIINTNYYIPLNYVLSWFSLPASITIGMKFKHLQRMEFNKDTALKKESIPTELKSIEYPAEIQFDGKSLAAKISLYGTYLDHVNSDKYSMRIKLKNGTIMGMQKFILMNPKVRYGLYDWFGHKLMKHEGLIALRYEFVDVSLNGEAKGVYILEEHFDKRLIENNRQRDGLILRPNYPLSIYSEKKLLLDPSRKKTVYLVKNLFKAYEQGKLHPHQLFDYEKMSRFLAVVKLIGGEHGLYMVNIRFFFNPITGRLEPIGREFSMYTNVEFDIFVEEPYRKLMADSEFIALYVKHLIRLSRPEYLNNIFREYDLEIKQSEKLVHRQQPYHSLDRENFYQNQIKIKDELTYKAGTLKASYKRTRNKFVFLFDNAMNYPIQINKLVSDNNNLNKLLIHAGKNKIIPGKSQIEIVIPLDELNEIPDSQMFFEVSHSIFGSGSQHTSSVVPVTDFRTGRISFDLIRQDPNPEDFHFLHINNTAREIYISPGQWTINKDIVLPSGFVVKCFAGTRLNLTSGASIISYSPLRFYGTERSPIIIESDDSRGKGIAILHTKKNASQFSHVIFRSLARPEEPGWGLTSAITFFESDVLFEKSRFLNNRDSEDALNIFRSNFSITKSLFSRSFADAIDIDYSNGSIADTIFTDCGIDNGNGDCLDISGSSVTLTSSRIDGASDKALSVGEKSRLVARDVVISNASIGVASKDSSEIEIDDISIHKCSYGFAAYQKKPEFGPASIKVSNFSGESIETLYFLEKESLLILNGKTIVQFSKDSLDKITETNQDSVVGKGLKVRNQ